MEPLPLKSRRIISTLFFILFVVVLIAATVYATGYRLKGLGLERTGGIYVSVPVSDAEVYLDGEEVGVTGLLTRSFFIDHLEAGSYKVEVLKEGYFPWEKTFIVDNALVTDAGAFMVPEEFILLPIVATTSESVATTTRVVAQDDYQDLLQLFDPVELEDEMATTTPEKEERKKALEIDLRDGNVFVHWNRPLKNAPNAFCIRPSACVVEVSVEYGEENVISADFYEGGVVYQTEAGSIYLAEIDVKHPQLVVPIYESRDAAFRIFGGELIILDGENLFVVSEF